MSENVAELCLHLVDDTYGELTSRVFDILSYYGRLPLPTIVHRTELTPRQVKHSLAVLVQQHLAVWITEDNGTTYYETNWENAYALVRSGKILRIIEDRYGVSVGSIVSTLMLSGHVRVGDLAQAFRGGKGTGSSSMPQVTLTNGHGSNSVPQYHQPADASLHSALFTLLKDGFLIIVHDSHFRSAADNQMEMESTKRSDAFNRPLKAADKLALESSVQEQLQDWKFNTKARHQVIMQLGSSASSKGKKRQYEDSDYNGKGSNKRLRSDNGLAVVDGVTDQKTERCGFLDDDLVIKVNHDKLAVIARNERFTELVERWIGRATAKVYSDLLKRLEADLDCCRRLNESYDEEDDDEGDGDIGREDSPQVPTTDVADGITLSQDMNGGIGIPDPDNIDIEQIMHPSSRRRKRTKVEEEDEVHGETSANEDEVPAKNGNASAADEDHEPANGEADDGQRAKSGKMVRQPDMDAFNAMHSNLDLVRQHLLLASEHPYRFATLMRRDHKRAESWSVNFRALSQRLRVNELEKTISARHGIEAVRLVRILREKGKLEEKTISALSLMNQKHVRGLLTAMHGSGHLELQEIPRDNMRQPSRTMFFWFFDGERCRQRVLEDTYKAMTRCLQRVRVEREAVQGIIDKAERTDVVGKEEEMLGAKELAALRAWQAKEERLMGEVGRLDDLVLVLRDF